MQLDNRVAVVTGAASGIGRAIAEAYAAAGAAVMVSDVNEDGGNETVARIRRTGGTAEFQRADIGDPGECERLVARTVEAFGRLDVACNNAGIGGEQKPTGEYAADEWNRVLRINLSGVFYCMRHQIPAMSGNGGGSIINIASILGSAGFASAPAYVAAKHGVVGLTKAAALDHAAQKIRVNAIGPAFIRTPLISQLEEDKDTHDMLVSLHPMGRLGEPEEIAGLAVFLGSDAASFITGSYYPVDGGYLAR